MEKKIEEAEVPIEAPMAMVEESTASEPASEVGETTGTETPVEGETTETPSES